VLTEEDEVIRFLNLSTTSTFALSQNQKFTQWRQ
jgi:hypothetical protein